jgi:sulfur-oxidizing protein SoxY
MKYTRRFVVGAAGATWLATAAASLFARLAQAATSRPAFDAATLDELIKALGGGIVTDSTDIDFKAPEIAENGAVVPLEITSRLPGTRSIAIVVEKNPRPLSAVFNFPDGTEPFIATRIKVGETSAVIALVRTGAGLASARRLVKVTLGGCGG